MPQSHIVNFEHTNHVKNLKLLLIRSSRVEPSLRFTLVDYILLILQLYDFKSTVQGILKMKTLTHFS